MRYLFMLLMLSMFTVSCSDDDNTVVDYNERNEADILKYLEENNLEAQKSESGLHYVITEVGNGIQPNANSDVKVSYRGHFLNGKVFDSNSNIDFNLQQVIPGWSEGLTYIKEGGSAILLIPSKLAYGPFDYNGIPGGSVLIFEVDLLEVKS